MKVEREVKTEVLLLNMDEVTCEVSHRKITKEVKEDGFFQMKIKSEPDLNLNDSIKGELLHEELDLKPEIVSNPEDQTLNETIKTKPFLPNPLTTFEKCFNTSTHQPPLKCNDNRVQFVQKDLQEKRFKCNICSYASMYNNSLKRHMRAHIGEKPFKCNACNYASLEKWNLELHMATHTGEKTFNCNLCNYSSTQKRYLQRHMKTHTGEKPFKCRICSYASAENRKLERHMKTHTGRKLFQCYTCGSKFLRKDGLQRHIKIHTRGKHL